jgi:hypothetical protein
MSLARGREAIVDALRPVVGVKPHTYRPTTPNVGDAWPLLGPLERDQGWAFIVTWRVLVLLPQDERAASDWLDANLEAIFDALNPAGFVDRAEPVTITAGGSEQFALQLTIRGEG